MLRARNFKLHELVCGHVFAKYGETAWSFMDPRLIETIDWVRDNLGKPIRINDYAWGGNFTQSGLRCNICSLVSSKKEPYMSAHVRGGGVDFSVEGMTAEDVRSWLMDNRKRIPHKIRLERGVNWVHLDVVDVGQESIIFFNP